jgi:methylated-DNA-[protein]-cysteine S-methyltransferase
MRHNRFETKNIIQTTIINTPLGDMVAGAVKEGICMLAFIHPLHIDAHLAKLKDLFDAEVIAGENQYFVTLREQLKEYFEGKREIFTLPLKLVGTPFQVSVWKELLKIPYGQTISYKTQAIAYKYAQILQSRSKCKRSKYDKYSSPLP